MVGLDWCGNSRFHRDSIPGPSRCTDCAIPAHGQNECLFNFSQDANWYWQLAISVSTISICNHVCLSKFDPHCRKHVPSWRLIFLNLSGNVPLSIIVFTTARPLSLLRATCTESSVSHSSYSRSPSLLPPSKWSPLYRHQSGQSRRKLPVLPTYQINCILK